MKKAVTIQSDAPSGRPKKVLALYDGVLKLLDEGADIATMKVSDITTRAGIGKGTAYEYFKRKEDIIAGALIYDMERQSKVIRERFSSLPDFRSKVSASYNWMLDGLTGRKAFSRFLYYTSQSDIIGRAVVKNLKNKDVDENEVSPVILIKNLCEQGKAEGVIRDDLRVDEAAMMLIGSMLTLVMTTEHLKNEKDGTHPDGTGFSGTLDPQRMKDILCEGFLAAVGADSAEKQA